MTRRHPHDALLTNPNDTAPPTRHAQQHSPWHSAANAAHATRKAQQSPRHGATQTTPWSAIPMAQWRPRETPASNLQDTATPRRGPGQQSLRHGHTQTTRTRPPAIPKTRRHPDDALVQSLRHSDTQTTPWSAIPKTRRHLRDTPTSNPEDTAPPRRRPDQQSQRHGATQTTP